MERWLELTERICLPILLPCIILIALHFSEGAYGAFWTYCWGCLDGVDYVFFLSTRIRYPSFFNVHKAILPFQASYTRKVNSYLLYLWNVGDVSGSVYEDRC